MMTSTHLRPWTITAAEKRTGPAHTWIRTWDLDRESLKYAATAAGWQWRCLQGRHDHALLSELNYTTADRLSQSATRTRRSQAPHVLVALAPSMPWTLPEVWRLATLGRAINMHLAVASDHLHNTTYRGTHWPAEFADNILGWYPGRANTR